MPASLKSEEVKSAVNDGIECAGVVCGEVSTLAGAGEGVTLSIMTGRDDNGCQAGVTPAPSDFWLCSGAALLRRAISATKDQVPFRVLKA
jgi:hypothetical protein